MSVAPTFFEVTDFVELHRGSSLHKKLLEEILLQYE